jgi:phage shock protein E
MSRKTSRSTVRVGALSHEKRQLQIGLAVLAFAVIAIGLILVLNMGGANAGSLPRNVNVQTGYELYQQDDVFVLDVREQYEWDEYHIPDTTLIPSGQLASRLSEVPRDKKILVVCRSGNRSQAARDVLLNAGYTDVTSMDGGVMTWQQMGFPTVP